MKIITWQYLLTDHQVFTWRELQKHGHIIQFVLGRTQDENRTKQGWNDSVLDSLTILPLPTQGWWKIGKEIIQNNRDAIHVFCGFWADRRFFPLVLYALGKGIITFVMNESYAVVKTGYFTEENKLKAAIKVRVRPILYKTAIFFCKLASSKNPLRVLAISELAEKQFLAAGVAKQNIFPWGYFVPQTEVINKKHGESKTQRLIFIGNLQHRKGLDLAIKAIETINNDNADPKFFLDIYGPGDPRHWIQSEAPEIVYKGLIPFGHSQEVLANYDYLILPSRFDGWGVVVNEALLQGVPVIVSDRVGAKILFEKSGAGLIFRSENIDDLINQLLEIIHSPEKQKEYAKQAALIAPKLLPSEAAIYLEEILEYPFQGSDQRPIPNWER